MRYPEGLLPEILDAYERDEHYFAAIRLIRGGDDRIFELGISRSSFLALLRVFDLRPFDAMPGVGRRYFFVPGYSKREDPERCIGTVRIEQGHDGKQCEVEMPSSLIANLLWFHGMATLAPAAHLKSWAPSSA